MGYRMTELKRKEVINQSNGCRIGFVDDLIIDCKTACICSLVIYGRFRILGIFGRKEDYVIPWENIELIGEDAILIKVDNNFENYKRKCPHKKQNRKFF